MCAMLTYVRNCCSSGLPSLVATCLTLKNMLKINLPPCVGSDTVPTVYVVVFLTTEQTYDNRLFDSTLNSNIIDLWRASCGKKPRSLSWAPGWAYCSLQIYDAERPIGRSISEPAMGLSHGHSLHFLPGQLNHRFYALNEVLQGQYNLVSVQARSHLCILLLQFLLKWLKRFKVCIFRFKRDFNVNGQFHKFVRSFFCSCAGMHPNWLALSTSHKERRHYFSSILTAGCHQ